MDEYQLNVQCQKLIHESCDVNKLSEKGLTTIQNNTLGQLKDADYRITKKRLHAITKGHMELFGLINLSTPKPVLNSDCRMRINMSLSNFDILRYETSPNCKFML